MEKKFNESQEKAVLFNTGPCLVLAGPGSGKTFVLINRIYNLIMNQNVDPKNILIITFTKAAANEMQERFEKLLNENKIKLKDMPTFGTFHSVFFKILKENYGYNNSSLIDKNDEFRLVCDVLEKFKKVEFSTDTVNKFINELKHYRNLVEKNKPYKSKYVKKSLFKKFLNKYSEKAFNEKKLDFFDMIDKCKTLLKKDKDTLMYYQNLYKYILIDEFQDINKSQYDLIKLICKSKNIFVVGDDDQSIYNFRGSYPRIMKDFIKDFRRTSKIFLNKNYRCADNIVKFSKSIIDVNKGRFSKKLVANKTEKGNIEIKVFENTIDENSYIIDKIRNYINKGFDYKDIAILYRTNLLANSIKTSLNKNNINYKMKGENTNIYDNFAIKDIIAYLNLAININVSENLAKIINKPNRYISRDVLLIKNMNIEYLIGYYKNKQFMLKYISQLKHNLMVLSKMITPLAIKYIRNNMGYDKYLQGYCKKKNIDYDEIVEILDEFEEEAVCENDIYRFLESIKNCDAGHSKNDENAISLMTYHLCKGLEFQIVFIIDANDGLIPHKKSINSNDIDSERRLFYVAITRAIFNLHIMITTRRFGKNFIPSRFILEGIGGIYGKKRKDFSS